METLLSLQNLTVRYGSFTALKGVCLSLPPGRIGLLGPNGAGKSTLLKTLLGLIKPQEGSFRVLGLDDTQGAELRSRVGYMPEADGYFPGAIAVEAVAYAGALSGLPRQEALSRAHEVLYYTGLEEARYRPVADFSTGMKQRVKLAQAIVHDPDLVLLDEPTSGMDPKGREEMLRLIRELWDRRAEGGHKPPMSVLLSTHLLHDVEEVCDQVILLQGGEVSYAGSLAELLRSDASTLRVRVRDRQEDFRQKLTEAGFAVSVEGDSLLVNAPDEGALPLLWKVAREGGFQVRHLAARRASLEEAFFKSVEGR